MIKQLICIVYEGRSYLLSLLNNSFISFTCLQLSSIEDQTQRVLSLHFYLEKKLHHHHWAFTNLRMFAIKKIIALYGTNHSYILHVFVIAEFVICKFLWLYIRKQSQRLNYQEQMFQLKPFALSQHIQKHLQQWLNDLWLNLFYYQSTLCTYVLLHDPLIP